MDPAIKHLHTDHCRLKINEQNQNLQDAQWETLETVPDAGTQSTLEYDCVTILIYIALDFVLLLSPMCFVQQILSTT
jgi:hypothetical protein